MWRRGLRGKNATCLALGWLSVTSPGTHKQIGPFWCWFPGEGVCVCSGPLGSLQRTLLWGWEFLLLLQPLKGVFMSGLRLYFPELEPWVAQSALLPQHSSQFIYKWMWDHGVCLLQPGLPHSTIHHLTGSSSRHLATSPVHPGCPSPPLRPVCMNVSSLSPWLSGFHTVRFSVSCGCFCCCCF